MSHKKKTYDNLVSRVYTKRSQHSKKKKHRFLFKTCLRADNSVVLTEDTDSFIIGDHVWVGGTKPGQIAYIGETQFAPGDWAGIVLDEPIGKFFQINCLFWISIIAMLMWMIIKMTHLGKKKKTNAWCHSSMFTKLFHVRSLKHLMMLRSTFMYT